MLVSSCFASHAGQTIAGKDSTAVPCISTFSMVVTDSALVRNAVGKCVNVYTESTTLAVNILFQLD